MGDRKVTTVFQTSDYSKFKLVDGNRPIEHAKKIKESIEDIGMLWQPVLVNEKYEIIDGQGRFFAMKTLALPIIYVIQPGLTIKEVRYLNKTSTNWSTRDYIHSYATGADAKYNYKNFEAVKRQFPEFQDFIIAKASGENALASFTTKEIKDGTYCGMGIDEMNAAIRRLTLLRKICSGMPAKFPHKRQFQHGILFCIALGEEDPKFSISQLEESLLRDKKEIHGEKNLHDTMASLDHIYNFNRSAGKRYQLLREYELVYERSRFDRRRTNGNKN